MQAKKTGGDFFAWQTCETARRFPYIRINRKKYFSGERTNERQVEFSGRCQQNARYCGQFAVFGKADFSARTDFECQRRLRQAEIYGADASGHCQRIRRNENLDYAECGEKHADSGRQRYRHEP